MKRIKLSQKFIHGFVAFAVINTLVIVGIGCMMFREHIISAFHQEAYQIARSVKASLPEEEVRAYADVARGVYLDEISEEEAVSVTESIPFRRMSGAIDDLREQFGAADIFVVGMMTEKTDAYLTDPDKARSPAYAIIDCDPKEDAVVFGDEVRFKPKFIQIMMEANESGKEPARELIGNSKHGYCIYSYVPLPSEEGSDAIGVGVALYLDNMIAGIRQFVRFSLIFSILVTAFGILIFIWYQMRNVINPIRLVSGEAVRFTEDQLRLENTENITLSEGLKSVNTGDELQVLAESVYNLENGIIGFARDLRRVTAEKERISTELDLATQIQANVLPKIFPAFPERSEFDVYASMTPAKEVGGDFYDFFLTDENHLALVIADVSGKGVPAALFMMIAKALIKTSAQAGLSPGKTLARVNNQLVENNDAMLFVTVWMAIIEISTGDGVAVNAAHEHPAIRRSGGQFELEEYEHSVAVGIMPQTDFEEHRFHLGAGDALFVYTDGVAEAVNTLGERFETERLCEALNEDSNRTPQVLCEHIKETIDVFAAGEEQFDDITMLAFLMCDTTGVAEK